MDAAVVIDDGDTDVWEDQCKVIDNDAEDINLTRSNSFIDIIDLEAEPTFTNNENAASDNDSVVENIESKNDDSDNFAKLLKSNTLMNKIVHKCLKLGKNNGMARVINKTLLPLYKNTLSEFKISDYFLTFLSKTLNNLKCDPNFKFSHIQSLCEILKEGKGKKKVPFITISKDEIGQKPTEKGDKAKPTEETQPDGQQLENVIDLDNSDTDKVITLIDDDTDNDDETDNDDVMFVGETKNDDNKCEQSNKENCNVEKVNNKVTSRNKELDNLLVPCNSVALTKYNIDLRKAMRIEKQIEYLKGKIDELEQKEVTNDLNTSPYVQCDKFKARIVSLYKILCKLSGNGDGNLMKQRVVRLQVAEGHPPGPANRLEQFLNSTIDETGSVPLPDYYDVVRCVEQSNVTDNLGWGYQQIMQEALALFTYSGKALRKSRQKREYKDLMSLVHNEITDDNDPANEDPELFARLEENKLIAKANEDEIIERYAKLGNLPKASSATKYVTCVRVEPIASSESDSENEQHAPASKRMRTRIVSNINYHTNHTVSKNVTNTCPKVNSCTEDINLNKCSNTFQNYYKQFISARKSDGSLEICIDGTTLTLKDPKSMQQEKTVSQITFQEAAFPRHIDANLPSKNNLMPVNTENNSYKTHIRENDLNKTNVENNLYKELASNNSIENTIIPSANEDKSVNQEPFRANNLQGINLSNLISFDSALSSENNILMNNDSTIIKAEIIEFNSDESQTFENNSNGTQDVENRLHKEFENGNFIENLGSTISHTVNEHKLIKQEEPFIQNTLQRISLSSLITFDSDPPTDNQVVPLNTESNLIKTENIENDKNEPQILENSLNVLGEGDNNLLREFKNSNSIEHHGITTPHSRNGLTSNNQREVFRQTTSQRINLSNLITFDSDLPSENNIVPTKTENNFIKTEVIGKNSNEMEDGDSDLNKTQVFENNCKELESNSKENHDIASDSQPAEAEQAQVKQEPVDIQSLMFNLGDNYFTTIYDIEDPFLVIDISSDSSSEDEL